MAMSDNKENNPSSLPAPITDVRIRTMNSDLQNMGMGGGIPQMNVRQTPAVNLNPAPQIQPVVNPPTSSGSKKFLYIIFAVLGVALLFILGFFLPKLFFKNEAPVTPNTPGKVATSTTPGTTQQNPTETKFVHSSFFKSASGGVINVALPVGVSPESVSGLISQQTGPISASFSELSFSRDSKPVTFKEFMNIYGWSFLPETFFTENFKDDFTTYVYKDSLGTAPGYVLELKPETTIVLLRSQLLKIESDVSKIAKFFLSSPISPAPNFADSQINGQPVRTLKFASGETFYYGWFNNKYLVFSTSEEGMKMAYSKL